MIYQRAASGKLLPEGREVKTLPLSGRSRARGPYRHVCMRQIEFPTAVEAHLVGAVLDREHAAEVAVAAAEYELENGPQWVHRSWARWRRSQVPLASSHSSSARTRARARAIAQSAAP